MTHTARMSTIVGRWYEIFNTQVMGVENFFPGFTIQDVFYGDQEKIPRTPAIIIEPGMKRREWPPKPNLMAQNEFDVHFLVYHVSMSESSQAAKMQADLLGDLVEEYINIEHTRLLDAQGNDLLIHGHVIENDPGYINRGNTRWHASHLTWRGTNKTRITVAG